MAAIIGAAIAAASFGMVHGVAVLFLAQAAQAATPTVRGFVIDSRP